ncbi:MAG TPA: hypothetical protein VF494_13255 [Candidatus Limnocylindrales bacterium]
MDGLGGIYAAALVVAALILVAICVVGAAVLSIGARAARRGGPDAPGPGRTARQLSTGLMVVAAAIAVAPLAVTLIERARLGPDAVPGDTELVATGALALGALSIAAARLLRHRAAVAATRGLLVAAFAVPVAIQLWVISQTIAFADRHRAAQEAAELRAVRYADLIDGPAVGEVVAAVGNVGSWRAVSGSLYPQLRYDEWLPTQLPVADLSGRTVRIAVYVQCWVEGDRGTIEVSAIDYDRGQFWSARSGACDGTMQAVVSGAMELRAWPADRLDAARSRDRDLIAVSVSPIRSGGARLTGEYAVRSVVFISPEPATPVDDLTSAVITAAGSFEIR